MKTTDFTQLGGAALTQDLWAWLQTEYTEGTLALAGMGNIGGPTIITGCAVSNVGSLWSITAGWVWYNSSFLRVQAGSVTLTAGNSLYVQFSTTSSALLLPFNSGATPNILTDVVGSIVQQPTGTGDSGTLFLLSELQTLQQALGVRPVVTRQGGSFVGTYNVTFTRDQSILFTSAVPANFTLNYDPTNAVPGAKVRIHWVGHSGGSTITVTAGGTPIVAGSMGLGIGAGSISAGVSQVVEITYLGNDGVSDIYLVSVA
jgi:hypothetical protein